MGHTQEPVDPVPTQLRVDGANADIKPQLLIHKEIGSGTFINEIGGAESILDNRRREGGDTFIFRDAPIASVVNEVMSEGYGLPFIIGPDVEGLITVRLEGIQSPKQAVSALNAALALQNYAIRPGLEGYIVTSTGPKGAPDVAGAQLISPGARLPTGTDFAAIMIQNARASEVSRIAQQMAPRGAIQGADDITGLITLKGDPGAVAESTRIIRTFDVDWLSAISTAVIPIEFAPPEDVAKEVSAVFSRAGGIEITPMPRLNAILVFARNPADLDRVYTWVARFDRSVADEIASELLIYEVRHLDAEYLIQSVEGLFGGGGYSGEGTGSDDAGGAASFGGGGSDQLKISLDVNRNAVLARGDGRELKALRDMLQRLDVPQPQILIEATIAEVQLNDELRFGVQWSGVEDQLRTTFSDAGGGQVSSRFPGISISYVNADLQAVVNALSNLSDVEIVSSPRVTAMNNQPARLQVGDQVPVITQSAVSVTNPNSPIVNSVSFRDTGVILDVTPHLRGDGMIEIEIAQEVSGVAETTTSGIDSPTITQRSIDSRLVVPDGSTAVLGGLISSNKSYTKTGVPILKDIPLVGRAFSSTGEVERRSELVVLIRPTLVSKDEPLKDYSNSVEEALLRVRPGLVE